LIGGWITRWIGRWKKLSAGERLRAQAVIACVLLVLYGLLVYPVSSKKFKESVNSLNNQKNRTKTSAQVDLGSGGLSPGVIANKIEEVEQELNKVRESFDELDTGFAPVDSAEMRQQLMLEISTLAERTGVELLSVGRKGFTPEKGPDTSVVDPVIGRPLMEVTANADFPRLLGFLHGLKDLSFYVAVMKLKVHSRHLQEKRPGASGYLPPGAVFVSFEMSI
jgi:hypothetical protein